jgi:Rieske Fe-S protein
MSDRPRVHLPLWREEVSHRLGDERYVNRRQFGKFLVLTSGGLLAGNAWIAGRAVTSVAPAYAPLAIATTSELSVGESKRFEYPAAGDACILIRLTAERHVAYSQKCTHLSCPVYYRADRQRLICPCHEGHFDAATGAVLQGPPPRPLPRVELAEADGQLVAVGMSIGSAREGASGGAGGDHR